MSLTDLKSDAVVLLSQINGLLHHTQVLVLRKRAGGVNDFPTGTSRFDSRPEGQKQFVQFTLSINAPFCH